MTSRQVTGGSRVAESYASSASSWSSGSPPYWPQNLRGSADRW